MWIAYLVFINILGFCLMGIDKRRSRLGEWRISEKTLFTCAACFGSLGIYAGMKQFRHKTKHWSFKITIPLLLVLQLGVIIYYVILYKGV